MDLVNKNSLRTIWKTFMFDKVSHTVQRQLEQLEMDDSKIEQIFDEENFAMRYNRYTITYIKARYTNKVTK